MNIYQERYLNTYMKDYKKKYLNLQDDIISDNLYIILKCNHLAGLFANYMAVVHALLMYELKYIKGLDVQFGSNGMYGHDEKNWWDFYFQPIRLGKFDGINCSKYSWSNLAQAGRINERIKLNEIIKKYIKLQPHIQKKIDNFFEKYMHGKKIMGIHYRGTDKNNDVKVPSYDIFLNTVKENISGYNCIYVATDDANFLTVMKKEFGDMIIALDCTRSSDNIAIHLSKHKDRHEIGTAAIMDCYLLAKTHLLIKSTSNVSRVTLYINPSLPVIELSKLWGE